MLKEMLKDEGERDGLRPLEVGGWKIRRLEVYMVRRLERFRGWKSEGGNWLIKS